MLTTTKRRYASNCATFRFGDDAEEQAVVDFYAHAKECGCQFFFGSDAHREDGFTYHRARGQRMADALGLTEADIFRVECIKKGHPHGCPFSF